MADIFDEKQLPKKHDSLVKLFIKLLEKHHPTTATTTAKTSSASAVSLASANDGRKGITVYNNADKTMYVGATNAVTSSAFWVLITAGGYWEAPYGYVGALYGIWATGPTGNALVTELT